jgi:HEAT repeat protein
MWVLDVIGSFRDPRVIPPLLEVARSDPKPDPRYSAVKAIGETHRREAVTSLLQLLDDPDAGTSVATINALGEIADSRAVAPIAHKMRGGNPGERDAAAAALGKIGSASDSALVPMLSESDSDLRRSAASALATIGDDRAATALNRSLNAGDRYVIAGGVKFFISKHVPATDKILLSTFLAMNDLPMADAFVNSANETLSKAAINWGEARGWRLQVNGAGQKSISPVID